MEFTRQERKLVQEVVAAANDEMVVQLTEAQLLLIGGGVADVTFS